MWDYNKMEQSNMEYQNTIIGLEQTYQEFKEQHVVTNTEFEKQTQALTTQIQEETLVGNV
jgi:uncharacterized protein YeeX (DUF496 family)